MLKKFYLNVVFKYSNILLAILLCAFVFFAYYSTKLEIDASAETLLLEDDKDLLFSRVVSKRYKTNDFLVITYTPEDTLLSKESLNTIKNISHDLEKLPEVNSVTSILTVPLLQSPTIEIKELVNKIKTLETIGIDKDLVKQEFLNSPLYKNNLVSLDFKTTAILVNLKEDRKYKFLFEKRQAFKNKSKINILSDEDEILYKNIKKEFKEYRDIARENTHNNIKSIREIIKKYSSKASMFLGGINMIADDIVTYVKSDLSTYGLALIFILGIVLAIIFKKIIWVILPLGICFISVVATSGSLAFFAWEITVISSNFIAMQLIITLSIVLHLIVRYRELTLKYTKSSQKRLVLNTMLSKANPTFFAIITTIAGFSSLIFSNIQPVINLGFMMSIGIFLSLIISFIIFPAILIKLPIVKNIQIEKPNSFSITDFTSKVVLKYPKAIYVATLLLIILSIFGSSKLIVENSFISYFKQDTAIYQGMKVIDQSLGGTTPLDIIVNFQDDDIQEVASRKNEDDDEESFDDEYEEEKNSDVYWFTQDKMQKILKIHAYLKSLDEIGAVQSFATLLKVAKSLNDNEDLDSFKLAILYTKLPLEYQNTILKPFINIKENQVRFSVRVIDSNPDLRRNILINKIQTDLKEMFPQEKIRLSNIMVLYNNMLQSLFDSQIKTLSYVALILFFMFVVLFRSFKIAFIAIIANIIPIGIVFAIMGFAKIPLDIMTITIAAISIGIGVDDTIHYVHRFKEEYKKDHNYNNAMIRSHKSIGNAMTYTSIAVVLGFLILVLSNLIPTIYFGLLTVLVMITILASALILLPRLLIDYKVFK